MHQRGHRARPAGARPSPVTAEITSRSPSAAELGDRSADDVGLGADHQPRPLEQVGLVGAELLEQDALLLRRRRAVEGGEVDEHAQHPGPLDVAEELVAEAAALAGPLDQAGDVGDDELGRRRGARRRGSAPAW